MTDPMTQMFGPSRCDRCGYEHASGFDCQAARAKVETSFRRLVQKARPLRAPSREPIYQRVGDWIRRTRKARGYTQEQVAEALGLSRPSLVNIEIGRQRIALDQFVLIVTAIDPEDSTGVLAAMKLIVRRP